MLGLLSVAAVSCLRFVVRVRHTATAFLNYICFKGAVEMSQKVRSWLLLPTALARLSAFTRSGKRPGWRPSIHRFGGETVAPTVIRAPLKGGLVMALVTFILSL